MQDHLKAVKDATLRTDSTEVLQQLIRNRCVNDGTDASGGETANARLLEEYLAGAGVDLEVTEPSPGRGSLIATLPGRAGGHGGLMYLGHTDVVPAIESGWRVPPFSGAVLDGMVWGRGAIDMLGMTATMAVALRYLASAGFRPTAELTVLAVADEEAGGRWGTGWLAAQRPELFRERQVITESGGFPLHTPEGTRLECFLGEKGVLAVKITVHGESGHAAFPYATDNAVSRLGEVLDRLRRYNPAPVIDEVLCEYVRGLAVPADVYDELTDEGSFDAALRKLPVGLARNLHHAHSNNRERWQQT
jgi:acetylornithine deacetylase/succinyl-diaminopimelate desuccinylase-like protein